MTHLKAPGGLEADFSHDVQMVAAEAKQVEATRQVEFLGTQFGTPTAVQGQAPKDERDQLYELLRERPSALIVEAWRDVEKAMLDLIGVKGVYVPEREIRSPVLWPKYLAKDGLIAPEIAGLIVDLRGLRNRVAHSSDFEPTVKDALEYHQSAKLVTEVLRSKQREIAPRTITKAS